MSILLKAIVKDILDEAFKGAVLHCGTLASAPAELFAAADERTKENFRGVQTAARALVEAIEKANAEARAANEKDAAAEKGTPANLTPSALVAGQVWRNNAKNSLFDFEVLADGGYCAAIDRKTGQRKSSWSEPLTPEWLAGATLIKDPRQQAPAPRQPTQPCCPCGNPACGGPIFTNELGR